MGEIQGPFKNTKRTVKCYGKEIECYDKSISNFWKSFANSFAFLKVLYSNQFVSLRCNDDKKSGENTFTSIPFAKPHLLCTFKIYD